MDTEETDDIGADIMKAMQADSAPEPVETEILPADTQGAEEQPPAVTADRPRDEHGRFAKTDEVVQTAPQAQAQEPAQPTIQPPKTWTVAAKAKFATLDPDVQQEILRREGEMQNGIAQQQAKAELLNRYEALIAPHRDRLTLSGLDPHSYLTALIRADEMLRTNPAQALPQIAAMYGLNLNQLLGQSPQSGGPQSQADPQVQSLQQYLAPFQQTIQELQQRLDAQERDREQTALAAAQAEINAFASDPAHTYFENVKDDILALLKAGRATDLADAYEKAIWANKDIRAILQATGQKPTTPQPTKPAGPQVTGAQRGAAPRPADASNTNTVEDDVREALAELTGRA